MIYTERCSLRIGPGSVSSPQGIFKGWLLPAPALSIVHNLWVIPYIRQFLILQYWISRFFEKKKIKYTSNAFTRAIHENEFYNIDIIKKCASTTIKRYLQLYKTHTKK